MGNFRLQGLAAQGTNDIQTNSGGENSTQRNEQQTASHIGYGKLQSL